MSAPFHGITVIDLTHVLAGPFCSTILSDLGARVIKVERPGSGDDTREFPPFQNGESGYFAVLNHGKESIALDLKAPPDREIFEALLERADVVLENYRPGVMERLGYGWEALHEKHPRLIYGAVSGYGHSGPDMLKPAYDMVVQARGGVMSITGEAGREPVRVGASVGDIVSGMYLALGVQAALFARQTEGVGRKVDIAMLDSQIAIQEHAVAITGVTGKPPGPTGARHPTITPFETFHASDALFVIAAGNDTLFGKLAHLLGHPEWIEDERFASNPARCENARVLKRLIEYETLHATAAEWIARLEAAGIPTAPIQDTAQAMADPQILARNMVIQVGDGTTEEAFTAAGNPIKMTGLLDITQRAGAPKLDADREAILDWLWQDHAKRPDGKPMKRTG